MQFILDGHKFDTDKHCYVVGYVCNDWGRKTWYSEPKNSNVRLRDVKYKCRQCVIKSVEFTYSEGKSTVSGFTVIDKRGITYSYDRYFIAQTAKEALNIFRNAE